MKNTKFTSLSPLIFIPLLVLIFIRPFFSGLAYPALEVCYENSIIFLAIVSLFISASSIGSKNKDYIARVRLPMEAGSRSNPYNLPILLLLLAYIISTIFSINIQNSIKEIIKFVSYISIFFLVSQVDDRQKNVIIKSIVCAGSIIGLYSIYQYFWGYAHTLTYLEKIQSDFVLSSSYARDILIAKRSIGTFPSPNILGSYLIMLFFMTLALLKNKTLHLRWLSSSFIIIIALLLTKSLGAWLSLVSTLMVLFILLYNTFRKPKLILFFCLIFIISALTFILITRWDRIMNLNNPQNSIIQRLNYWLTAISMIKEHPIVGVGPGNFQEVFLKYKVGLDTDTRYAHNIFLHTWSETGLLGLVGVLYLIIRFFQKFKIRPEDKFIFLSGLAFILHNLIDNSYFIPQLGIIWWILLSL